MNKWDKYKSFENWKRENFNELMNEYKSCKNSGDSMKSTDYIDFNDFCIGKWQKLDY
jgi:hypothetical protein